MNGESTRVSLNLRTVLASFYLHDALAIIFLQFLSCVAITFFWRLPDWQTLVVVNALSTAFIILIASLDRVADNTLIDSIHRYYIALAIFGTFKEIYILVPAVNPDLYDSTLIAIDHALFGLHPTQWLEQFSARTLVEILQLCYSFFYLIMLALAVETSVRGQNKKYEEFVSTIVYGFFLSYIGYLLVPAIGPRFTLHDFPKLDLELPGLWFTDTLRSWINSGESIAANANFILTAQRDAFPSGHTEMTLITMACAWRYRAAVRWYVTIIGIGLIFGTVFLRYHYVIDLIGGAAFFLFTMKTYPAIARWWQRCRDSLSSR